MIKNQEILMLAFYKAKEGRLLDKLVSKVIFSEYSHVEIVLPDGSCFSASPRDKGVRVKNINIFNSRKWDLYKIESGSLLFSDLFEKIKSETGKPYDYLGAVGSGIKIPLHDSKNRKYFCSKLVAELFKLPNVNLNPESLRKKLISKKLINPI